MRHFARYRGLVQSVSGFTEVEGHEQLRDAIAAIGREIQSPPPQRLQLKLRMETLSSLVRLELQREHEFVEMLAIHLNAPQINAFSAELLSVMKSEEHGSASDGDESRTAVTSKVEPNVASSVGAVIERSEPNDEPI